MRDTRCAALLILLVAAPEAARQPPVKRQAVRQVDRILVESTDPRALYDLFSGSFQLPVAWPLTDTASHTSGSFGTGNLTIEVFGSALAKPVGPRAHFAGIAF